MQPIDIQRVRGELKWDGLESTPVGRILQFPTNSAVMIANLARKPGVNPNMVVNCFIAMTVIAFLGTAAFYAIRIVWVR